MNYNYLIDLSSFYFIIFIIGCLFRSSIENIMDWFNNNKGNTTKKLTELFKIHPLIKKYFSYKKVKKIENYHREHTYFSDLTSSITTPIVSLATIFGVMPFTLHLIINSFPGLPTTVHYIILALIVSTIGMIVNMPISYYSNFVIEAKYGFNKMTKRIFFVDHIKSFIFMCVFTPLVITIINYSLTKFGPFESINILYFVTGAIIFGMIFEFLYMTVFIRIFNKLTPLKNKALKKRIDKLLSQYGYNSKMVYVMDASTRSSKSNAFIGGIGKSKKIVLFDTLLKNFTNDEIIAILGHELAHGKLNHLILHRLMGYISIAMSCFIIFNFAYDVDLYHTFGFTWVNEGNVVQYSLIGMLLMSKIKSSILWILEPLESWISRKFEYAADRYSIKYTKNKKAMISALIKLSSENMSDIFPDKYYEAYHYSHPSLSNRINAINEIKIQK